MRLDELTIETATPLVGTRFQLLLADDATIELQLLEVLPYEARRPRASARGGVRAGRKPFSMYFVGPPQPVLPQAMYDFHSEGVSIDGIFIVPIGRDDEGVEYEAVFA